jgi:F0F1-type ATP synthase assembly protein I
VIPSSDPDTRRLAVRILLWQAGVTVALAALCVAAAGLRAAVSALAGGAIGVIANLYMTLAALRPVGHAGLALGRIYVGQFVKLLLTVAMFYAVARAPWVSWPAVIGAYIATMVAFWVVPVLAGPRLPPRSKGNGGQGLQESAQESTR